MCRVGVLRVGIRSVLGCRRSTGLSVRILHSAASLTTSLSTPLAASPAGRPRRWSGRGGFQRREQVFLRRRVVDPFGGRASGRFRRHDSATGTADRFARGLGRNQQLLAARTEHHVRRCCGLRLLRGRLGLLRRGLGLLRRGLGLFRRGLGPRRYSQLLPTRAPYRFARRLRPNFQRSLAGGTSELGHRSAWSFVGASARLHRGNRLWQAVHRDARQKTGTHAPKPA